MPEAVDLSGNFDMPPQDAVRYFRGKGYRISRDWTDVWGGGHARNFTVAKVAQIDLLTDIRRSLDQALANGETFESWKARIIPTLVTKGWWGTVRDAKITGTGDAVVINPRRLKVIYDTNLRTARAAGQWARIQAAKATRPYLRYSAVMDRRTRPQHRAWHSTILPVDHPWWQTHFPPNGWFCRCNVQQLSERDMKRLGYQVSTVPPEGPPTKYVSKTGFTADVPAGIDAGFGQNTGREGLAAIVERAARSMQNAVDAGLVPAARQALKEMLASPAVEQFLVDNQPGMPIAIIDDEVLTLLGGTQRVVTLSARTLDKITQEKGRFYPADVYRAIQAGIDAPRLRILQANGNVLTVFEVSGKLYVSVIRALPTQGELWLSTLFRVNEDDLDRLRRTGQVQIDAP